MKQFKDISVILMKYHFQQISALFIIPHRQQKLKPHLTFFNYYGICCEKKITKYYIRNHSSSFCITPYHQYKQKKGAFFSIGKGLINGKEQYVLLAEYFATSKGAVVVMKQHIQQAFMSLTSYQILYHISEEFGVQWLKISVCKKSSII